MKGLKKIALASAIAAVAAGAQAELKALDDSTMGELTGQAGLVIDLETEWTIGEFAYQDAGFIVLRDLSMGGNSNEGTNSMLDNIRMEIDVAGAGAATALGPDNLLKYGFSNVKNLAAIHAANGGSGFAELAQGSLAAGGFASAGSFDVTRQDANGNDLRVDDEVVYNDGDLKIHFTFTDAWQKGGGFAAFAAGGGTALDGTAIAGLAGATLAQATDIATSAVDFEFNIGQIGIAASTYDVGNQGLEGTDFVNGTDADTTTTTLISDLSIKGYLGPADILIENKGNGFGADGSSNILGLPSGRQSGNADSKIQWDSFFKVTDLDVYIDIAGVQITDMAIHNERGDQSSLNQVVERDATGAAVTTTDASGNVVPVMVNTSAFGFAQSKREIYAVKDTVLNLTTLTTQTGANIAGYVDGIAINTRFKGDIDIGALSFGDTGTSIGKIYLTDITSTTNWTISAK